MASPVGHTIVGLASAAVVQRATAIPPSPELWIGAFIASGVPDLDVFLQLVGLKGPRYHRNVSHSIFLGIALVGAVWLVARFAPLALDAGVLLAWLAAIVSHPLLDYVTTGPRLGESGYGIALLWPFSRRRFYSRHLFLARDRGETHTWDYLPQALEETIRIGPVALLAVLAARAIF